MKFCVKCGASNADSAKFCTECGAEFAVEETNNTAFTYNEVDDSTVVNKENTEDTTYTYGESVSDVTVVDTDYQEKSSADTDDKYKYTYNADNQNHTTYNSVHPGIAPRNIVVAIILSFVTCGIYQIYWMIKMNDEVNTLANEPNATSGVMVFIFSLITCGIYSIYWSYKMGERCDNIKGSVGGNSAILYLILTILGFGIVTYCLVQDTINKAV